MADNVDITAGTGTKVATNEINTGGGAAQVQRTQPALALPDGTGFAGDPLSGGSSESILKVQQFGDGSICLDTAVPPGFTAADGDVIFIGDLDGTSIPPHVGQPLQLKRMVIIDKDAQGLDLRVYWLRSGSGETPATLYDPPVNELRNMIADPWVIAAADWLQVGAANTIVQHNFAPPDGFCWDAGWSQASYVIVSGSAGQVISGVGQGFEFVTTWEWV